MTIATRDTNRKGDGRTDSRTDMAEAMHKRKHHCKRIVILHGNPTFSLLLID